MEARLQLEKKRREPAEAKRLKEREEYLARLAKDFPKAWQAVNQRVEVGSGKAYDEARQALVDLAEAYTKHASRLGTASVPGWTWAAEKPAAAAGEGEAAAECMTRM